MLNTIQEVRELQTEYQDTTRFTHRLLRERDYINDPKPDGYRGVHLVYEYNNTLARNGLASKYKGLAIELQLRTKLQHTWATAVETMGTFRNESYKSNQGNRGWLRFFALVSSAFAHVENTALVPQFAHMNALKTYQEVKKQEAKLEVLDQISGLSVAANAIHTQGVGGYYNLIVLDRKQRTVRIDSYARNMLGRATAKYAELEAAADDNVDQVLVSVGRLNSLKAAYPNYFLDVRDFIEKVGTIISEV